MKKTVLISSLISFVLIATQVNAQVSVANNTAGGGNYVGWATTVGVPLQIRHNGNQPINFFTNNLMRATFTTGNAFGTGSTQGDGFRIFDTSGGPGHLDL